MFTKSINEILILLAITVIADKRVFANEIDTFINSARNLETFQSAEPAISPAKLLLWFETHRDELKEKMEQGPSFQKWLNNIIDDLADHPDKFAILNKMIQISKADGEVHISEKALITLTARRWKIRLAA